MSLNLEQKIYVQICALFALYIQLNRKMMHTYLHRTRESKLLEMGMNYRTQEIISVLVV